ncbi:hypothetical protein DPMN_160833 [Dreissena polymorpha]|uniref:Uncharacterized protein n=2 Tax=Dreissena polymorpha TaxID=45954 RepID=A0A9D4ENW0_DREPO|nr:hypothetical protein DPMN_160833 [Dreissena polymorpha]
MLILPSGQLLCVFKRDATMVEADVLRFRQGKTVTKHKRRRQLHTKTLQTLCQQYSSGRKTMGEFLDTVGHNIRLR